MKLNILVFVNLLLWTNFTANSEIKPGLSFYLQKPDDPEAVCFSTTNYKISNDGKTDVSDALQFAINKLKLENNFGIILIPEGKYTITKTIYIPEAIRLIGYGKNRPEFILKNKSPGFQLPVESDKGKANYMFWFTGAVVEHEGVVEDANAGTFYSALININLKIEDGNPEAVAVRTHYAQHSFVSHCDVFIGNGKAGLFDVGNEMEDVRFFGGNYGIYTTKTSPGWQFMMLDTYFEGQRKAAIKTQQAGLTIIRMQVKNVPKVIEVDPNYWEKLYMQDCQFINVAGSAITFDDEENANMQVNLRNIYCQNVSNLVNMLKTKKQTVAPGQVYRVKKFIYGLQMSELNAAAQVETTFDSEILKQLPQLVKTDIPIAAGIETWVNIKNLGAKGDGETDDTKAIEDGIAKYQAIYFPQGLYKISRTIKLKPNTMLVGLHPISTQIFLEESSLAFSGFGSPVPMIEAAEGGKNILSGIGLSTGEYNYRAVACKWTAGANSMIEDVKFVGGHGSMNKGPYVPWTGYGNHEKKPSAIPGPDPAWDTQYWSLWITNNGGGIFKNIWTANTYATSGLYVSNTSTPSCIYAVSVEHHVRNEVRFSHVSNWNIYALQLEEESREGSECQPMEINECNNLVLANLYMFRVIRVKVPYPYSIRTWHCRNIELLNVHNYSQVKYTTDNPLYDINSNTDVRPVEFARLFISGSIPERNAAEVSQSVRVLVKGFEFAEGLCSDSHGNLYFSEQRKKRIYKWSAETNSVSLLADYPWEPLSLACDSRDNLLVVFRYDPQPGYLINGLPEKFTNPPDAYGTSFSAWGNSGFATLVYSVNPNNPDETIQALKQMPMNQVSKVYKALYPSNRWRDSHDFNTISVARNKECFVAPDGITIIPDCYDLARSCALIEAFPGKTVYASDEYDKRTVKLDVDANGFLSNLSYFAEKGEFSSISDGAGNVYIADGDVYVFDSKGRQCGMFQIPERPSSLAFGGKDKLTLFVTGRSALYSTAIPIKE